MYRKFPGHYFPGSSHHHVISEVGSSRAKVNSLPKIGTMAPGISLLPVQILAYSLKFLSHNPSPMPLERILCSQRLPRVPFKHNENQAIEMYTGFSKGSSIMWRLCHGQQ